jgi:hypothetical protein
VRLLAMCYMYEIAYDKKIWASIAAFWIIYYNDLSLLNNTVRGLYTD